LWEEHRAFNEFWYPDGWFGRRSIVIVPPDRVPTHKPICVEQYTSPELLIVGGFQAVTGLASTQDPAA
jgi:hypothetical protein